MVSTGKMLAFINALGGGSAAPSEVVILPETVLTVDSDAGIAPITAPLQAPVSAGDTVSITYNGTAYECTGAFVDGMGVAFGNLTAMGATGGNPDAPFTVILAPNGVDDDGDGNVEYGAVMPLDGAATITLSIVQVGAASGGSGNADSVLTITADMSASLSMSNISAAFADAYKAVAEGRQVRLLVVREDEVIVCTLGMYSKTAMFFYCMPAAGTFWSFTFNDDDTMTVNLGGN